MKNVNSLKDTLYCLQGYMKVSDFKRCEVFLNQPHAVIPDSGRTVRKPDAVYGYITEDENYDNTARKETVNSDNEKKIDKGKKNNKQKQFLNQNA
jgi:hypothetical protein